MSSRSIAVAAALLVGVVIAALVDDREVAQNQNQNQKLRSGERWLGESDFFLGKDGATKVSRVIEAPHTFTSLGASWKASPGSTWSHRVSSDGRAWGDWLPLPEDTHGSGNPLARAGELQFYPEEARFLQVRAEGDGGDEIDVDKFHAVFVQPAETTPAVPPLVAASAENPVPKPPVVSRTDWGCPDGQGSRWPPVATDPDFLIVHHSAGSNSSNNWAATVQAIWSFHTITRGWGDVGYNFLIDPNGVIYEGRAGGDSIGAHFSCTNGGTMGVCMIGDFTGQEPTTAALDSLAHLLAWKADLESIDPLAQAFHPGSALTLDTISGHRDGNPGSQGCASGTVCPGAMLYPLLPGIRTQVANIIETGTPFPPVLGFVEYETTGDLEPGAEIDLSVTLRHVDGAPATGVTATLTTTSPYVSITDATKEYPDLGPGESDDEFGDFDFVIATDVPHGHQPSFTLAVTAAGGSWDFVFSLPALVVPPQVALAAASFSPDQLSAGENVTVAYQLVADRAFGAGFELSLIATDGGEYPLAPFTTNLNGGAQTKNRGLQVPIALLPGSYALRVRIADAALTVTVADETFPAALHVLSPLFMDWAVANIPDAAFRVRTSDPDGDGLSNLLEYALLLDPMQGDASPMEFLWVEDAGETYPALRFVARGGARLGVVLEVDDGSGAWADEGIDVASDPVAGGWRQTIRSPNAGVPRQLMRLRVTEL